MSLTFVACTHKQDQNTAGNRSTLIENKQLVVDAIEKVFDGQNSSLIDNYYADGYIQHNPTIKDGKEGLYSAIDNFKKNNITIRRVLARVVAERDLVFTQSRVSFIKDNKKFNTVIVGDIFRIEKGKIKEHWDVIQKEKPKNDSANGNSMIDGGGNTTKHSSQDTLDNNKMTVNIIVTKVLGNNELTLIDTLFKEPYIQHNPRVPNGTASLKKFLSQKGKLDLDVKELIAEGDIVVAFLHMKTFGNANIDMFRLDEKGKAVEHWDIIQKIPDTNSFAHKNGFF
jgi:predicted SnoaL-like aldol condensation-catalyzing enzyme